MSGGSFDYAYLRMSQFADDLGDKLDSAGTMVHGWHVEKWPPDVESKLREIAAAALHVSKLAKEAEWLYSGDTGEDIFMERVKKIEDSK